MCLLQPGLRQAERLLGGAGPRLSVGGPCLGVGGALFGPSGALLGPRHAVLGLAQARLGMGRPLLGVLRSQLSAARACIGVAGSLVGLVGACHDGLRPNARLDVGRLHKLVKKVGRVLEVGPQLDVFARKVKTVEAISVGQCVIALQQPWLPHFMHLLGTVWTGRLHHHNPRPEAPEVHALQNGSLKPLHIHLQKMNLTRGMRQTNRTQGGHRGAYITALVPLADVLVNDLAICCCPAAHLALPDVDLANAGAHRRAQVDVAGPIPLQGSHMTIQGLNIDAVPTLFVKQPGDGVDARVIGAHVNVETSLHMLERAPKHDIFKILRVGNDHSTPPLDKY